MVGIFLFMLNSRRIDAGNASTAASFFLVLFVYINILRERTYYGDVQDYLQAAANLSQGASLHPRYLYPPLWATLLQLLLPSGERTVFDLLWVLNIVSLGTFYLLLHRALVRFGFDRRLAAIAGCIFLIANVPVLRTLSYGQINLHLANLVLVSLLAYPRHRWLSALALALAIHLKVSPMVLILPFIIVKDFRWLAWLVLFVSGIAGVIAAANGWSPYLDFIQNASQIYTTSGINFRENSIDSFYRALAWLNGSDGPWAAYLIWGSKLALAIAGLLVARRHVVRSTFYLGDQPAAVAYNAFPALSILMVMLSPLVWTYHPVLAGLSYLLLLRSLQDPVEWLLFALAYYLEFLVPTFDFFPWSYVRLLSPLLWMYLAWRVSRYSMPGSIFMALNGWFGSHQPLPGRAP